VQRSQTRCDVANRLGLRFQACKAGPLRVLLA